jgi:hypothetical protein
MNLGMLLVLCVLLPDLPQRGWWLLRNLFGRKAHVSGLNNLPGIGGVLLVSDAPHASYHRHVVAAVDRRIRVYTPSETRLSEIAAWLKRGHVAMIPLASNSAEVAEAIRGEVMSTTVVPVHCDREGGRMVVAFAPRLEGAVTEEALQEVFSRART